MRIATVHKATIALAIALCAGFAVWGIFQYRSSGETLPLVLSPLALLLGVGLAFYHRSFIRHSRKTRRSGPRGL
jgi:hypothetical protein